MDPVSTDPRSRATPLPTGVCLAGVAVVSVLAWLIFIRPVTPLDFNVFLTGGRDVAHGRDPYPALGSPQVWSGSAFVYPWLTAWLFAPASAISAHAAALVMTVLSTLAVAVGVWSLRGPRFIPVACVLASAPTLDGLQMGTLNAFLFLGVCLCWRWRDRAPAVGVTIGVLITLKILCWPLAVWLLMTRRWRGAAWAGGAGTALIGTGWILGPLGPFAYGRMLDQLSAHETDTSSSLQGILVRWSVSAHAAELIGIACAAVLVALVSKRGDAMIFSAAVVGALLASPVVWHHYYLLAAAPVLLIKKGEWWYLLIGWASVAPHLAYGISWRPVSLAANICLAVVCAGMIWARRDALVAAMGRATYRTWAAALCALTGVAALAVALGDGTVFNALYPSLLSVSACVTMLVVGYVRTSPNRSGADGNEEAEGRRTAEYVDLR
ncbi:MAG: glycosyltransferase 87 family protein [Jatrophihabitantaceae bacterium]